MSVSSKCYYAIRAIYALAEHGGPEPLKISEIAERELIPIRFLEVILGQLKGGGFVHSRAGGGGISAGSAGRPVDRRRDHAVRRRADRPRRLRQPVAHKECEFHGECHFFGFWGRVRQAISDIVDRTTFADLVREDRERKRGYVGDWVI